MPKRDAFLVAYDSPSDRRRARLLRRVRGFGIDPQYSFHDVRLSVGERRELWRTLADAVAQDDRLFMIRIGPDALLWRFGSPAPDGPAPFRVVTWVG